MTGNAVFIATLVIVSCNFVVLLGILLCVWLAYRKLGKTYKLTENNMLTCTKAVLHQLEYMTRWQKVLAKMINDDRRRLQEHDGKVEEMYKIARAVADKFLGEEPISPDAPRFSSSSQP